MGVPMIDNEKFAKLRPEDLLQRAYDVKSPEEAIDLYRNWAGSYDADLPRMGYEAPKRAASIMVEQGVPFDAPILDAGCGTGLTGLELSKAGYSDITGIDLSLESLQAAEVGSVQVASGRL